MTTSLSGNYHRCSPIEVQVDQDRLLLCASGSVVVALDAEKGDLKFSFKGHQDIITCIYHNPANASQVISSSIDGVIITWDLQTREEISRDTVGVPVQQLLYPEFTQYEVTEKTDLYLVINKTTNPEDVKNDQDSDGPDRFKMVVYDVEKKKIRRNFCPVSNKSNCMHLAKFAGAEFVLAASKRKLAVVFPESRRGFKSVCSLDHNLTCISSNSNKEVIITGHMNGQILIWHDVVSWISSEAKRVMEDTSRELLTVSTPPACTVLHWHAHNVTSLAANLDGSLIYSGGDEGVLVVWQTTSGAKAFIPHLGAAISHIAASKSSASAYLTTNSNTVRAVNTASLLESWMIQSLCIGPFQDHTLPSDKKARCQIVSDPNSDAIVCNGYPGYLQFYDAANSNVNAVHEVVHYNRVTRTESHTKLYFPSVSFFKFHSYVLRDQVRHVLATVDVRRGEEYARDVNLKFWEWSDSSKCFRLMTHIPRPHGEHRITSVAFNPSSTTLACATTAVDGSVKYWRSGKQGDHHWTCVYSFTFRSVRADACSFSSDGSVFAVAHANVVSLWEPNSLVMRASFVLPSSDQVKFTGFIEPNSSFAGCGQAYLVVGSKRCLTVFDLLTMNRLWSFNGHLSGFSIASSDKMTMQNIGRKEGDAESGSNSDRSSFGWIAVCNSKPKESKEDDKQPADNVLVEEEGETDDEDAVLDNDSSNRICELSIFSIASNVPLLSRKVTSEVTSSLFWAPKSSASSLPRGVLCATAAGELVLVGDVFDDAPALESRHFPDAAALTSQWADVSEKLVAYNAATLPSGFNFRGARADNRAGAKALPSFNASTDVKENFLGNYFDDASSNIPPVSSIYDDFMGSLLRQQKPDLTLASPATSLSALIKASKKGKADAEEEIADVEDAQVAASGGAKSKPNEEPIVPHAQTSHKVSSFSDSNAALFSQMVGAYLKKRPAASSVSADAPSTPAPKKSKSSGSKHEENNDNEEKKPKKSATPAPEATKTPGKSKK